MGRANSRHSGRVKIEIINTGSELMLGNTLNTHHQWLCRQLAGRGYRVSRQMTVSDTSADIVAAVGEAAERADLLITTGGLGPTSDDLTRDVLAAWMGRELHEDPRVTAHIEGWFKSRQRPAPPGTRIQAMVPQGAEVLINAFGTAPGLILDIPRPGNSAGPAWLVMLPGPPRELRPMFTDQVLPWVGKTLPLPSAFVSRTLRTTGIGESVVQQRIAGPLERLVAAGLEIGYCARPGEVDIRLSAAGDAAGRLVAEAEPIVLSRVGEHVYGEADESLEQVVVRRLTALGQTLVVAESCTGGRLSSRITDVPGASAVFLGGLVTYSNALKKSLLGVRDETLAIPGAVSEASVREMAEGARVRYGADHALAITGIAGPGGGTTGKPVGTVFLAHASAVGTAVRADANRFDRETFKQVTVQQALEMLRQALRR